MKKRHPTVHRFLKLNTSRRAEIKKSLLSSESNVSFTLPLTNTPSICSTLFTVGPFSISQVHLKSLDYYIPVEKVVRLKRVAPDFQRGWLYDTVIAAFIHKVVHDYDAIDCIDPAISELVRRTNPFSRIFSMIKDDFQGTSKLIIPFNVNYSHWVLAVALISEREIHFYDPIGYDMKGSSKCVLNTWIEIFNNKLGTERVIGRF